MAKEGKKGKTYTLRRAGSPDRPTVEVTALPAWLRSAGLGAGDKVDCRVVGGRLVYSKAE